MTAAVGLRFVQIGVFLVVLLIDYAQPSPGGAPSAACSSMKPSHAGIDGQTAAIPYELTLDASSVQSGQEVTLRLKVKSGNSGEVFKGFLIQAKYDGDANSNADGTFSGFE